MVGNQLEATPQALELTRLPETHEEETAPTVTAVEFTFDDLKEMLRQASKAISASTRTNE